MTEGSSRGGVGAAWPVRGRTSAWAGDVKGTGGLRSQGPIAGPQSFHSFCWNVNDFPMDPPPKATCSYLCLLASYLFLYPEVNTGKGRKGVGQGKRVERERKRFR